MAGTLLGMEARRSMGTAGLVLSSVRTGLRSGLDWTLSVGYGVVYDFIFERFAPYQSLQAEVLALVAASAPPGIDRHQVRILDVGCGPGNFSFALAEAGFSVLGVDPYRDLVELAREKRRARHLRHLAFQQADLARTGEIKDEAFDVAVNIHSLYVHPAPDRLLAAVHRVLKPGGHAVFVNFTRRIHLWSAFEEVRRREGWASGLRSFLWVLPNAIFEATRKRIGPHYWEVDEFARRLTAAGFTVLATRRTFFNGASLLVLARKDGKTDDSPAKETTL